MTSQPISGNQYFAKVSNSDNQPSTILNGVNQVIVDLQVPASDGALNKVSPVGANVTLSDAQLLSFVTPGFLLVKGSGLTAARSLLLGADTSARALQLKNLLLTNGVHRRLLKFEHCGAANAAFALSLANSSGTSNNVQVSVNGGAVASTQVLMDVSAVDNAYVVVQEGTPGVPGEEAILFNIVYAADV